MRGEGVQDSWLIFFFKEKLFRAWEQTLPLHMKIRNFSTKPASLIKTLLSELRC